MTNDERNPKPECRKTLSGAFAGFVIRISSFLRISSFVIRICEEWFVESLLSFFRMHWDPEPADRAVASWSAPVLWRFRPASIAKAPEDWGQNLAVPPTVHGEPQRRFGCALGP